jgi:transposase
MYIDEVPNRNSPPAFLLRESRRVGGKTVKKTLANLSALPPEALVALRSILKGETLLPSDHYAVERSLPCGHVRAITLAMDRLGMTELIASKPSRARDVVVAMVAQRLLRPGSKLETGALFSDTTLAQDFAVEGADENDLYAALDWLLERQPFIEKKLAQRHLDEGAMVFYDVSSSTYYGSHCPLAVRGKNRDGLKLPCIVYGLLTDREGRPVAIRVYPGNTGDPATVPDQLQTLRKAFGIGQLVVVGDRGMLTQPQIAQLRTLEGCGWISCLRSSDILTLLEAQDPSDAPLFTSRNIAEITHPDFEGERLIACYNPLLAQDRERTRHELLDGTEGLLKKLAKEVGRRTTTPLSASEIGLKAGVILKKYKVGKHFSLTIQDGCISWTRRTEEIAREKSLDGIYVIRTSEPSAVLSTADAVKAYKRLGNVEKAFRTLKGVDLSLRPIHHRLENRVRAHIFLCMLAYYLEWHMRQALAPLLYAEEDLEAERVARDPVAQAKPSVNSQEKRQTKRSQDGLPVRRWDGLLQALSTMTENTCRMGEGKNIIRFKRQTEPTPYQQRVFDLLDQSLPRPATPRVTVPSNQNAISGTTPPSSL